MLKIDDLNWRDGIALSIVTLVLLVQALVMYYSPLNLSGDEAYYWLWSKHLDYCYYEKGDSRYWFPALLCIGVAALFKYTSLILLPSYIFFLLLTPGFRKNLINPAFILRTDEIKDFKPYFSKIMEDGEFSRTYDSQLIGKSYFYVACNFKGSDFSKLVNVETI